MRFLTDEATGLKGIDFTAFYTQEKVSPCSRG